MAKIAIILNDVATIYDATVYGVSVNQFKGYDLVVSIDGAVELESKEQEELSTREISEDSEIIESEKIEADHEDQKKFVAEGVGRPSANGYKTDEPFPQDMNISDMVEIKDQLDKSRGEKGVYIIALPEYPQHMQDAKTEVTTALYEASDIMNAVKELVDIESTMSSGRKISILRDPRLIASASSFNDKSQKFYISESLFFHDKETPIEDAHAVSKF